MVFKLCLSFTEDVFPLKRQFSFFSFLLFSFLFWPHPWHVEVPRPGIEPAIQQWPKRLCNNAGYLTHCATRELQVLLFFFKLWIIITFWFNDLCNAQWNVYVWKIFLNKCLFLNLPMPFGMGLWIDFVITVFLQSFFKITRKYTFIYIYYLIKRNAQKQEFQNLKKQI